MPKFKLDFTIPTSQERMEFVKNLDLSKLSKTELETVSNYILYGKDSDGTSIVDRKEVQIKTKFNSYQKDRTTSLDALMESPTFDENIFQKNQKTIYKKVKPTINREKVKDIPGMVELWKEIDRLTDLYNQNIGKTELKEDTPRLNQNQLYYLNHQLIEMRNQQYLLVDSVFPTFLPKKNRFEYHESPINSQLELPILPRGVFQKENDLFFIYPWKFENIEAAAQSNEEEILKGDKPYIDFRNKDHLYYLIQYYEELKEFASHFPDSIINNLLWTLDFYIEKANLSDQQRLIINDKKFRLQNKEIREHLEKELNISHRENYISTIWNKSIDLIVEAVELNYDEYLCKDYKKAWKTCSRCGRLLLRDPRNFVRKSKAADGLTNRCKQCDKELRQNKK